ncbi:MAG: LLM class flavin-dependent oxidoreductase [Roseiflexaceae bacterium]
MRFSIRFNNDRPVREYMALARAAEAAGFDQFWVSDDLFLYGVWPILASCATVTERIQLGTCIVNPYTMHPAEMAMQAIALDELSGGRALLGIGAGAGDFLGWVGLPQERPLTRMLETIAVLRALFAGERVAHQGTELGTWSSDAYMRTPTRQIPIYLGAMSPKMLEAIGSHADGGLPLLFPPEHYAMARNLVDNGIAAAQRDRASVDMAACIWISVGPDTAAAEAVLRHKIAYYGHALSDTILANLGVPRSAFVPIEHAMQHDHDEARACALVTPEMLRIGITGSGSDVLPRLQALVNAGARHISFGPPLGPDPLRAIEILGTEVLPVLRQMA